jgi:hypothetical protein
VRRPELRLAPQRQRQTNLRTMVERMVSEYLLFRGFVQVRGLN